MRNKYWERKRKEEKGIITVVRREKKVDFTYRGKSYTYLYISTSQTGFAYIYDGTQTIYTPHAHLCTDLGREIYKQLHEQKVL